MPRVVAIQELRAVLIQMDRADIAAPHRAPLSAVCRGRARLQAVALHAEIPAALHAAIPAAVRVAAAVAPRMAEAVAHPAPTAATRIDFFPGALIIHTQGPDPIGALVFFANIFFLIAHD
jgi:hypothetical protein